MYADDNKVIAVNKLGTDNGFQEDINNTVEWCRVWSMCLNDLKCKVMHFGKNNPKKVHVINQNGVEIALEATEVEKDLGVMVTMEMFGAGGSGSEQGELDFGNTEKNF